MQLGHRVTPSVLVDDIRNMANGTAVLQSATLANISGVAVTVDAALPEQELVVLHVPLPQVGEKHTSFSAIVHAIFR